LWILAFLGGFSDRFFEGIIQRILGQFKKSQSRESAPERSNWLNCDLGEELFSFDRRISSIGSAWSLAGRIVDGENAW